MPSPDMFYFALLSRIFSAYQLGPVSIYWRHHKLCVLFYFWVYSISITYHWLVISICSESSNASPKAYSSDLISADTSSTSFLTTMTTFISGVKDFLDCISVLLISKVMWFPESAWVSNSILQCWASVHLWIAYLGYSEKHNMCLIQVTQGSLLKYYT